MPSLAKHLAATALLVSGASADVQSAAVQASLEGLRQSAPLASRLSGQAAARHTSADAANIVGGLTEAFLGTHSVSAKESQCLADGASTLAAGIVQSCHDAVGSYRAATISLRTTTAEPVVLANGTLDGGAAAFPWLPVSSTMPPLTGGEDAVITMEFAARFAGVLDLERQLAKRCLHDDAVHTLEMAAKHMSNLTYVGGCFVANGVDVLTELTDATAAFEGEHFSDFGKHLGGAWRKVLLSRKSERKLDMPSKAGIEEMTQALMANLFGDGLRLQIQTDSGDSQFAPMLRGGVYATPAVATAASGQPSRPFPVGAQTINIDLRNCLVMNMPLFQSAWTPVWKVFEDAASKDAKDALPDMSSLVVSMFDLQLALRMCGLGPQQEAALLDAMKSGEVHAKLGLPDSKAWTGPQEREHLSKAFAEALQDWKLHSWSLFGGRLGDILRDMIVITCPQKYSVDDLGQLRALLVDDSDSTAGRFAQQGLSSGLIAACAMLLVTAVVLTRRRWQSAAEEAQPGSTPPSFDRMTLLEEELDLESVVE
eukprot:TRINITY_DN36748_c0_g1_i1.p1 TRINITY_DN36748_c0_g1~~TRINITY_DN36748_c0_g1_i1.p1  ORF type:complete len:540 (-),score=129.87 TRINITY_DN36748_c0_g1_i1:341-1960(-)